MIADGPFTAESIEMFQSTKSSTSADDIIVFFKPRVMRLMTDRMSVFCCTDGDSDIGDLIVVKKEGGELVDYSKMLESRGHGKRIFDNSRFMVIRL